MSRKRSWVRYGLLSLTLLAVATAMALAGPSLDFSENEPSQALPANVVSNVPNVARDVPNPVDRAYAIAGIAMPQPQLEAAKAPAAPAPTDRTAPAVRVALPSPPPPMLIVLSLPEEDEPDSYQDSANAHTAAYGTGGQLDVAPGQLDPDEAGGELMAADESARPEPRQPQADQDQGVPPTPTPSPTPTPTPTPTPLPPTPTPEPTAVPQNPAAGMIWPATGWFIQEFGCTGFYLEPWDPVANCRFHHGIDIANVQGTPILAAQSGHITFAGWSNNGYGYNIQIDHGGGYSSLYAHLCCQPPVTPGQWVERGQQIGLMGTTGASTGPHLHFEIRVGGSVVNPRGYLPPK